MSDSASSRIDRTTVDKPKILFLCHRLAPIGGGEGVAAWMLQALSTRYDVTIFTWEPPDLEPLNQKFGTAIYGHPFRVQMPSPLMGWLMDRIPDDSRHHQANYLLRMAKKERHRFDAVVTWDFEAEVDEPAISYVHYPHLSLKSVRWTVPGDAPLFSRMRGLISGKTRPWMLVSGYSFDRLRRNLTLTNSHWTRNQLAVRSQVPSTVVYPPAAGNFMNTPWDQRQNAFIAVGRLVPEKRYDWMMETLAKVREKYHDVEFHICGSSPLESYLKQLEALAARHGRWAKIHRDLTRQDLTALLSRCRYGIHAFVDEHFGMAPAEMARAGCIPFVHASGGQTEIVDNAPQLCFTTAEDAATKILTVLGNPLLQQQLRKAVSEGSRRFTPEAFMKDFLDHVEKFLISRKQLSKAASQ